MFLTKVSYIKYRVYFILNSILVKKLQEKYQSGDSGRIQFLTTDLNETVAPLYHQFRFSLLSNTLVRFSKLTDIIFNRNLDGLKNAADI